MLRQPPHKKSRRAPCSSQRARFMLFRRKKAAASLAVPKKTEPHDGTHFKESCAPSDGNRRRLQRASIGSFQLVLPSSPYIEEKQEHSNKTSPSVPSSSSGLADPASENAPFLPVQTRFEKRLLHERSVPFFRTKNAFVPVLKKRNNHFPHFCAFVNTKLAKALFPF